MFLSQFVGKPVLVNGETRGVCLGVGLSLKTYAVKYLFCSSAASATSSVGASIASVANVEPVPDFAVSTAAVCELGSTICLTHLRTVCPKSCVRIFPRRPIYSADGVFLGALADLELRDFIATRIFTDRNTSFPVSAISVCADAVFLRKDQPYPLGQRIPAPLLSLVSDKKDGLVTRPVLRGAIEKGALVKLTLSLPPFGVEFYPFTTQG